MRSLHAKGSPRARFLDEIVSDCGKRGTNKRKWGRQGGQIVI